MAQHIRVVLTEDLATVGKSGELVKVRPGFARNYLIPRGLAIGATIDNVSRIEHEKKVAESRAQKARAEATDLAQKLSSVKLAIKRQAGEGDKLYGAVTTRDIEEGLAELGYVVDRRRIVSEPIKSLGTHSVTIRLAPQIQTTVEVEVVAS
jgi:large subunit ribosomal protein L9